MHLNVDVFKHKKIELVIISVMILLSSYSTIYLPEIQINFDKIQLHATSQLNIFDLI